MTFSIVKRTATFSPDKVYRYELGRQLEGTRYPDRLVVWIMLNPSTADEFKEDPTIRRVIGFSAKWGFGQIMILNMFAYRSPIARTLVGHPDPVGPDNDYYLLQHSLNAELIVVGWGNWGRLQQRSEQVRKLLPFRLSCLGTTGSGHPRHPLYLSNDSRLEVWTAP